MFIIFEKLKFDSKVLFKIEFSLILLFSSIIKFKLLLLNSMFNIVQFFSLKTHLNEKDKLKIIL
jgi:hypothetical protein